MADRLNVTFADFSVLDGVLPLAAGYMQTYARRNPVLRERCSFDLYSAPIDSDLDVIVDALVARDSDVYGFGCYVWNVRLVQTIAEHLRRQLDPWIVLGGPQVMHRGENYIPPGDSRTLVCNGEGERTFAGILEQILSGAHAFGAVPGLTFLDGGKLRTTAPAPRISDLAEIPSPFTEDRVFPSGEYAHAIFETNRGCPYRCGFCFWGAATNDRVYRFDEERVKRDITWISENMFPNLFIADANWGMLPRDIEFTDHIVECAHQNGYPMMVVLASAKNSPQRVVRVTERLVKGGLLASQAISLQTLNPDALAQVDRANIKPETYNELQRTLMTKEISSYIELIWPLPGETPRSFREGIATLCRAGAETIIVYSHLLLPNTPLFRNQDSMDFECRRVNSDIAESDIIVSTKEVTKEEFEAGLWFYYATHFLHNLRGLHHLSTYLERSGQSALEETFEFAARFFRRRRHDDELCAFFDDSITSLRNYEFQNSGIVAHISLFANRKECDRLLVELVAEAGWLDDPLARAAFELDLLSRPAIYSAPPEAPDYAFEAIAVTRLEPGAYAVALPEDAGAFCELADIEGVPVGTTSFSVVHTRGKKLPFMSNATLIHSAMYCQAMILRMRELRPEIRLPASREPVQA